MSNKNYVQGLLDYIIDIKPYHSKLTQIIEEYTFTDSLTVKPTDSIFIKSKQSSIWDKVYTTDGYQRRFVLPPFISPRYSTEVNDYSFTSDKQNDYCYSTLNLPNVFQVREARGIESVKVGNSTLIEGLDYHLSHGAFSFEVLPNSKWQQTNLKNVETKLFNFATSKWDTSPIPSNNGSIISLPESGGFLLADVNVNFDNLNPDSWTIICTDVSHDKIFEVITPTFEGTSTPPPANQNDYWYDSANNILYKWISGAWTEVIITDSMIINAIDHSTWNIPHNLNNKNLMWEIFVETPSGLSTGVLTDVILSDFNNGIINFNRPYSGKIRIFSVPSLNSFIVPITDSSKKWTITHNFNTLKIIAQVFIDQPGRGLTPVLPESLIIVDNNTIEIHFSKSIYGKVLIIPAETSIDQIIPATSWDINSPNIGLSPIVQVFTIDSGSLQQIIPKAINIIDNDNIQILFTKTISGYITIAPIVEGYWFTIYSKLKGSLGTIRSNTLFTGNNIQFSAIALPITKIGAKATISLQPGISLQPTTDVGEIWSLIKVNPIVCEPAQVIRTGLASINAKSLWTTIVGTLAQTVIDCEYDPTLIKIYKNGTLLSSTEFTATNGTTITLVDMCAQDDVFLIRSIIPQEWHLTCITATPTTATFEAVGSVSGILGFYDLLQTEVSQINVINQVLITCTPGIRLMTVGDSIVFMLGYDGGELDASGFDGVELDVIDYEECFTHINSNLPVPQFIPFTASFINAPAETWTFMFQEGTNDFTVVGSISGPQKNATIGEEYENGIIRLRIVSSLEPIDVFQIYVPGYIPDYMSRMVARGELIDGDKISLRIYDKKPNYLVHGSLTGFTQPAVLGEYYWNGKIGFFLDLPKYRVSDEPSVIQEIRTGQVTLTDGTQITFNRPPRFDADDERLNLTYHEAAWTNAKLNDPTHQFLISSSTRGYLPAAVVGTRYKDLETVDNYPNVCSAFDFTIDTSSTSSFTIAIEGTKYKPFHLQQMVILTGGLGDTLQINTFQEDKFLFKTDRLQLELGSINDEFIFNNAANKLELNTARTIPTYLLAAVNNHEFTTGYELDILDGTGFDTIDATLPIVPGEQFPAIPDRGDRFNVFLSNVKDVHIGTISWQFDTDAQFYRQVIDVEDNFVSNYLTLNTNLTFEVQQADEYNQLVGTLITDHLSVLERIRLKDLVDVSMEDKLVLVVKKYDVDTVNANITFGDRGIGYDNIGYDLFPYDNYEANNVYRIKLKDNNHVAPNTNYISTAISDFGLSVIISHPTGEAGYEDVAYDIGGYALLLDAVDVFKQLEPAKFGPRYVTKYTLVNVDRIASIVTIELPGTNLTIGVSTNIDDLDGTRLIEGIDYGITLLSAQFGINFPAIPVDLDLFYLATPVINNPVGLYEYQIDTWVLLSTAIVNPTYRIDMINVQPIIVFGYE